jgi:hypothetical protein
MVAIERTNHIEQVPMVVKLPQSVVQAKYLLLREQQSKLLAISKLSF